MATKHDFGYENAVFCVFMNGNNATAILNNHMYNQGDRGYNPIRLAEFLQTFLSVSGFKATIKVLSSTFRPAGNMEFPRRSVEVKLGNKTKKALLDQIINFNEMFEDSPTYADFETKLGTKPAAPAAAPVAAPAAAAPAAAPVAAASVAGKKSFAVASAAKPQGAAAAQPAKDNRETALQAKRRLLREQEELKEREQKIAEELSKANEVVKLDDAKYLKSMLDAASERDPEFMEQLLAQLQNKVAPVKKPTNAEAPKAKEPEVEAPKAPNAKEPEVEAPKVKAPEVAALEVKAPEVAALEAPKDTAPEVKAPEVAASKVAAPEDKKTWGEED